MDCSNDEVFEAVLSKNEIARAIKNRELRWYDDRYPKWMIARLKEIEKATGTCNQPSVEEIQRSRYDI